MPNWYMKRCFSLLNHQGSANQNHEISLIFVRMAVFNFIISISLEHEIFAPCFVLGYVPVCPSLQSMGTWIEFVSYYCVKSEKAMATHSSTLAWKIPWLEEPGGLQSMGSLRVRYDWASSLSLFTFLHWRRKWQPIPVFLPGESRGQRSLVGCCP